MFNRHTYIRKSYELIWYKSKEMQRCLTDYGTGGKKLFQLRAHCFRLKSVAPKSGNCRAFFSYKYIEIWFWVKGDIIQWNLSFQCFQREA
ncbi:CLUMA_CG006687, isoform A [Clunio marinus]|uniref:CLUMA_CG006687, isoform A n=1 Tax=Clunio marinus TaxID=568069 RepID=A0A1J1HYP1_9DIPT|nr:CLUMA_CG006687, isoform A [Clunio marinus]